MFRVTKDWINSNKTKKGAWTKAQIHSIGIEWPPRKGWMNDIHGAYISFECARLFESSKSTKAGATKTEGVSVTLNSAFSIVINGLSKLTYDQLMTIDQNIKQLIKDK